MNLKSISALLFSILLISLVNINAQQFKEKEKTFKLNADGKVTIETYKGEIRIETWDKPEVYVYAKMVPEDNFLSTKPEKQLERVDVEFDSSPDLLRIKSEYQKSHSWFGSNTQAFVNYEIKMPKTAALKIKDYKSETKITGLNSDIELDTYKGEVKVYDLTGSIDLETYKGEVQVDYSKIMDRNRFNTYKGEIEIRIPKNSSFTIDSDLNKKADLRSNFGLENTKRRKHEGYNFTKDIKGGGPVIEISSNKGEIRFFEK